MGVGAAVTRARVFNLREIGTHRLRLATSLIVVVVASALLVAVLGTYGSLTESVRQFNAALSGDAQVEVAGISDTGVDEGLAAEIRRLPDAESVVPLIRGTVMVTGQDTDTLLLGSDYRAASLSGALRTMIAGSGQSLSPDDLTDGVIVGNGTGLDVGDHVVIGSTNVRVLRVIASPEAHKLNDGRFVFAYLGLAQKIRRMPGRVDSILVKSAPGVDPTHIRAEVSRLVDGRAAVLDPDFRTRQADAASAITRDSTLLVSLISLVIAAFLVFNTMTMAVASRRRSLAMVRALGAKRRHLFTDMLTEAACFGVVGGAVGVPVGIGAGWWAISQVPPTSGSSQQYTVGYHLPAYAPVLAIVACVVACVGAAALAARPVLRVAPVEAMVAGEVVEGAGHRATTLWLSVVGGIAGVGGAWAMVATMPGRPVILAGGVFAIGALLLCFAATVPLAGLVVRVSRLLGGPGRLASVNTSRAPRRAWATLMTVAVAIAVGMGTSGALDNLVSSISTSLDGLSDPDLYVAPTGAENVPTGPVLPAAVVDEVSTTPGVARVVSGKWAYVNVGDARILMQGVTQGSSSPFLKKMTGQARQQVLAGDGIVLSRVLARTLGVHVGDTLRLATPTGYHQLKVRDTVDYVTIDSGTAAMSGQVLSDWFDRPGSTYLEVYTEPGADKTVVQHHIEQIANGQHRHGGTRLYVYTGAQALAATKKVVQQSGAFTVAIQWIVSVAAAIALLNTLLLSVIERRRELAVLRAMGASRKFLSRMVISEAAAVALVGSAVGLIIGSVLHYLADAILTTTTSVQVTYSPRPSTLLFVVISVVLCLIGSAVPAWRAARLNISESIAEK